MTDRIINFYEELKLNKNKKPKNWKHHHIEHNSHILCIGATGTGKSNTLMNYILRSKGEFKKIIIFSGSTTDEPLYKVLKESNNKIEFYNDIEEMPSLEEYEETNMEKNKKLIIWDDWINLTSKELKKIFKFIVSSRKYGCSNWLMAQSYTSVPKIITRNVNYIILFRINDNISINNILKNHNILNVDKDLFKRAYILSTYEPLNFLLLDFKSRDEKDRVRYNFLNYLDLQPRENRLMLENDEK